MRWPLRYQIMAPMAALMLVTVLILSAVNAGLAASRATAQIRGRLRDVAATLAESNFPLTASILGQMKGLAGAEFVLVDERGEVLAASSPRDWRGLPATAGGDLNFASAIDVADGAYYHAIVAGPARVAEADQGSRLHVLYPQQAYRDAWRRAIQAPLLMGGGALLLVMLLAAAIAGRVARPLTQLRDGVRRLGSERFEPLPLPARDDEVKALIASFNQVASKLAELEGEVRRSEQWRLLGQLRAGLAHQLRNSATGARMALAVHQSGCSSPEQESLAIVERQLDLMERYLKRFLKLGGPEASQRQTLDLAALIRELLPLVEPAAAHVGVAIRGDQCENGCMVHADRDGMEHLVLNLVLNAVEAAAQAAASPSGIPAEERSLGQVSPGPAPQVAVILARRGPRLELIVEDTGRGVAPEIAGRMFEPFVTDKPEGAGLGLSVARQVVAAHGGGIACQRLAGRTRLVVDLPAFRDEARERG